MTTNFKELEDSLNLCIDMKSPSIVLPLSTIEKYFPVPRLPSYPNIPCYDLEALQKWAQSKGWKVEFATTGTIKDRRMVPGIRFLPLVAPDYVPEASPNQTKNESSKEKNWQHKILIYIAVGVVIIILGAFALYLIKKHFGVPL